MLILMSRTKTKLFLKRDVNNILNEDKNIQIGNRIKKIRRDKGLTTEEFAMIFDPPASKGTVSKWENGKYLPNNKRIKDIAALGDISVNELLYGSLNSFISSKIMECYEELLTGNLADELEKFKKDLTLNGAKIYLNFFPDASYDNVTDSHVKEFILTWVYHKNLDEILTNSSAIETLQEYVHLSKQEILNEYFLADPYEEDVTELEFNDNMSPELYHKLNEKIDLFLDELEEIKEEYTD